MARVPTYDSFQATPAAMPQVRVVTPDAPDVAGLQAQQTGRAMASTGQAVGQIALDMQQQANQLRVDDALNRVKEAALRLTYDKDVGFQSLKGLAAVERPDSKSLADEYGDTLQQQISDIASKLGNDAQREAFMRHANDIQTSLRAGAMRHAAQEYREHGLSVAEGIQNTALREIGLSWRDPAAVASAVNRIRAQTYRQAQILGKSAEWQEAHVRKMTSSAHSVALMAALDSGEPMRADAYLRDHASEMDADDITAARRRIDKEVDQFVATKKAGEVLDRMQPRIQVGEAERAFNIALGTESGTRQFGADGKPLTSPKGAVGIAQVMPGTGPEAAKLAGLPWDEHRYRNDANYNRALGLAYFQKQLQTNGGDLAKAYAAYNAGPGRLAEAEKRAEKNAMLAKTDPGVLPRTWLDFMPAETRAYVAKNMRAYAAGEGQLPRPTLADLDDALRADPALAANPERLKLARAEATRRFEEQTKAIKQREEEATAAAMRSIIENGGRWSELPPSVRAAVPPKEVDNLIGFAQKIAKGEDRTSLWRYAKLAANPEGLAKMTDDQFYALRGELSEADFKHFANERAKLQGRAQGSSGPGDLNSHAIKQTLDSRLRMLEIDPSPKDDGGSDAARVGAIRQFVDQYFAAAQAEAGKKFSDAEVSAHLDALFAKSTQFRNVLSSWGRPMLSLKASDLNGETREKIIASYKRQGVEDPTDAQILLAYWNMKVRR